MKRYINSWVAIKVIAIILAASLVYVNFFVLHLGQILTDYQAAELVDKLLNKSAVIEGKNDKYRLVVKMEKYDECGCRRTGVIFSLYDNDGRSITLITNRLTKPLSLCKNEGGIKIPWRWLGFVDRNLKRNIKKIIREILKDII